jgi:hypothetical protein
MGVYTALLHRLVVDKDMIMANSYIITSDEIVLSINDKLYAVSNSHVNFEAIIQAAKDENFELIPRLIEQDAANSRSTAKKDQSLWDMGVE